MDDSLNQVVEFIKKGRSEGLEDIEIAQGIMVGNWGEKEKKYGQDFLRMTQKIATLNEKSAQEVIKNEETWRKKQLLRMFLFRRALPIFATLLVSVLLGVACYSVITARLYEKKDAIDRTLVSSSTAVNPAQATSSQTGGASTTGQQGIVPTTGQSYVPPTQIRVRGIVMCTQDKQTCPDGTLVGRVPPACTFLPCTK